jgi:hypothetical protein
MKSIRNNLTNGLSLETLREKQSVIMEAQDQAISTNYFRKKILKQETESICQLCKEYEETIDHLISGCPTLAKNEYIIRHDKVCTRCYPKVRGI